MNAVVDPATADTPTSTQGATNPVRRIYAGEGYPQTKLADQAAYVALVPSDDDLPREALVRLMVADALQRNGRVVDEDTLEGAMADATGPGGVFAETRFVYKLTPGETRADGMRTPPFVGYELPVSADAQKRLVEYVDAFEARHQATPAAPLDHVAQELKGIARADGKTDVLQTLDAVDEAIKAGQSSRQNGGSVDQAAMAGVMEYFTRVGKERQAAKLLERYTAVKGVVEEAKVFGQNIDRVFNGRDPVTRQPIDTDRRVDAAFDLLSGGFKVAGGIGSAASLLGVGGRLAPALLGVAPVGVAIVGFAAGAYSLIKHIRAEILAPRWDEIRERFPFCPDDADPKKAIKQIVRNIAGMPVDGDNALSTASRIMDGIGQNPETRARFAQFLKGKVEPDSLVDALAAGKLETLTRDQAMQLARAAKDSSKEFFDLEINDAKRYIRDKDGDRSRGTYLLEGDTRAAAERNTNKLGGAVDEALRVGSILLGGSRDFDGMLKDMLGKVKGTDVGGKPLTDQQKTNLAGAALAAASAAGLAQVDHLVPSKDGSKLFAVQGDPQSETRRVVTVDVAIATSQSLEASARQFASQPTALQVVSQPETVQRAM